MVENMEVVVILVASFLGHASPPAYPLPVLPFLSTPKESVALWWGVALEWGNHSD